MGGCLWLESFTSSHPRVDITGVPVVCHCITNYPQTQKVKALTLFYSSFCGSGTHRACFHLGFSWVALYTECIHMRLCTDCNHIKDLLLGWMAKIIPWLTGFTGSWPKAQLGLPIEARICGPFMCSWLPQSMVTLR